MSATYIKTSQKMSIEELHDRQHRVPKILTPLMKKAAAILVFKPNKYAKSFALSNLDKWFW